MMHSQVTLTPEQWMAGLFGSQSAQGGRVLRRKLEHIDRYVGREAFIAELRRRGYHAVENANQMIIFCNNEPLRIVL